MKNHCNPVGQGVNQKTLKLKCRRNNQGRQFKSNVRRIIMASAIEDSYRGFTLKVYAEHFGRRLKVVRSTYERDGDESEVAPLDFEALNSDMNPISQQFEILKDLIDHQYP